MKTIRHEEVSQATGYMLLLLLVTIVKGASAQVSALSGPLHRQVIVSIPDRKLAVIENGTVIRVFPVAVGAAVRPSPTGAFLIVNRLSNPTYYHPGVVIPAGTDNPIGPRWIGLNRKGYGIHGTNEPRSIGQAASHGCIRLRNADVKDLYRMVRVGDMVEIRAQRDDEISQIFRGRTTSTGLQASAQTPAMGGQ